VHLALWPPTKTIRLIEVLLSCAVKLVFQQIANITESKIVSPSVAISNSKQGNPAFSCLVRDLVRPEVMFEILQFHGLNRQEMFLR
jgi:cell division protein FtsL